MKEVQHTALDGSRVNIRSRGLDLSKPASSIAVAALPKFGRKDIKTGGRPFGAWLAKVFRVTLNEEYAYQSGTLRVGESYLPAGRILFAVWEGVSSSVATELYNDASASDAVALFENFALSESPSGDAIVTPRSRSAAQGAWSRSRSRRLRRRRWRCRGSTLDCRRA